MNRGWWIGIAAVVACLCGAVVVLAAGVLVYRLSDAGLPLPQTTPVQAASPVVPAPVASETAPAVTASPAAGAQTSPTAAPAPALDEAALPMLKEIEQQVVGLRGLEPKGTFELQTPTYAEYREITIADFEKDYSQEEALDDGRVLSALGLLPKGFDLYNLYIDLYSENILGAYDQDTKTMYVLQAGDTPGRLGGVERQTYSHEYQHALQDQNYGLEALGMSQAACELNPERCAAIRGLVEGEATLVETQWLDRYGTSQDYADIADFYRDFSSPAYNRAPCYLRDDFYWPYDDGTKFVQGWYDSGGWAAVDEVYQNPPVTTEQIMHPGLYRSGDLPEVVPTPVLTETLGAGWRQIDAGVMGEWYTRLILVEPFRNADASSADYCTVRSRAAGQMADAAAGWGGDAYVVFYEPDADRIALVMLTTWDSAGDAQEFAGAFSDYSDARFGPTAQAHGGGRCWATGDYGASCLFRRDTDTLWVMAPDAATIDRLVDVTAPR